MIPIQYYLFLPFPISRAPFLPHPPLPSGSLIVFPHFSAPGIPCSASFFFHVLLILLLISVLLVLLLVLLFFLVVVLVVVLVLVVVVIILVVE